MLSPVSPDSVWGPACAAVDLDGSVYDDCDGEIAVQTIRRGMSFGLASGSATQEMILVSRYEQNVFHFQVLTGLDRPAPFMTAAEFEDEPLESVAKCYWCSHAIANNQRCITCIVCNHTFHWVHYRMHIREGWCPRPLAKIISSSVELFGLHPMITVAFLFF